MSLLNWLWGKPDPEFQRWRERVFAAGIKPEDSVWKEVNRLYDRVEELEKNAI